MVKFLINGEIYDPTKQTPLEKTLYENLNVIKGAKEKTDSLKEIERDLSYMVGVGKQIMDILGRYKKSPDSAVLSIVGLNDLYGDLKEIHKKTSSKYYKQLTEIYMKKIKLTLYAANAYLIEPQNAALAYEFQKKVSNVKIPNANA